ncbi:MAG: fasciclin domain-containing protein [Deltaproteobacteria bacterium]|nr:fasciclin domain-containing protein [Deltaproteobacteria bacterium]
MSTAVLLALALVACSKKDAPAPAPAPASTAAADLPTPGTTAPPADPHNIVNIAIGSKDHSTLVAALKAANYVTAVANPGPLTVFAPTNAAFEKLPPGTVEGLLKPEKLDDLKNVLKYHVTTSSWDLASLKDGMEMGMSNGGKAIIHIVDGKVMINDATIIGSIKASNGMVHVIDTVLLPR